jgi:hypothetical protein
VPNGTEFCFAECYAFKYEAQEIEETKRQGNTRQGHKRDGAASLR